MIFYSRFLSVLRYTLITSLYKHFYFIYFYFVQESKKKEEDDDDDDFDLFGDDDEEDEEVCDETLTFELKFFL